MKCLRTLIAIAAVSACSAANADTASSYVGEISGLVCASCKAEVVAGLAKLPGVTSVEITPSNNPEIRRITINATREALTSEEVNQALDKVSKDFKVSKLAKASPLSSK